MGEKKLHTREFQLNGTGGNMRCKLLQKRSAGKTTVFKHFQALIFTSKLCDPPPQPPPQQLNSLCMTKVFCWCPFTELEKCYISHCETLQIKVNLEILKDHNKFLSILAKVLKNTLKEFIISRTRDFYTLKLN